MYSFECQHCAKRFEEIVAYDRREQMTCPTCGGQTRVLFSAFAVKGGSSAGAPSAPARSPFS